MNFEKYTGIVSFVNIKNVHWNLLYHTVCLVGPSINPSEEPDSNFAAQKLVAVKRAGLWREAGSLNSTISFRMDSKHQRYINKRRVEDVVVQDDAPWYICCRSQSILERGCQQPKKPMQYLRNSAVVPWRRIVELKKLVVPLLSDIIGQA